MDRRHEAARDKTEEYTRRKVVLSDPVSHLEVLVEHGCEREWNRLCGIKVKRMPQVNRMRNRRCTLRLMTEVGG